GLGQRLVVQVAAHLGEPVVKARKDGKGRAQRENVVEVRDDVIGVVQDMVEDRKSTRLNSSHVKSSYAVFCLKKKIGAATKTLTLAEIRGEQQQTGGVAVARMAEPASAARPLADREAERQAGHARAAQLQIPA